MKQLGLGNFILGKATSNEAELETNFTSQARKVMVTNHYLFIYLFIYLSIYLFIYVFIYLLYLTLVYNIVKNNSTNKYQQNQVKI